MATRCDACGREEYMPFLCKFCAGRYCVEHRLPENHACAGLPEYKAKLKGEGRLYAPPHEPLVVRPRGVRSSEVVRRLETLWSRADGNVTYVLLGIMAATFLLEYVVLALFGYDAFRSVFLLGTDFAFRPWSLLTSIFAHSPAGFGHIFFNGLVLFFFGVTLERLVGSRRFLGLFLAAGLAAGLAQVLFFGIVLERETNVLGASGAIMGILGALTVLAPRMTVLLFFVIPAPLWLITAGYALVDITYLGVDDPGDRVARLAHLTGLAIGLAYGKHLRDRGLRVRTEPQGIPWKRYAP